MDGLKRDSLDVSRLGIYTNHYRHGKGEYCVSSLDSADMVPRAHRSLEVAISTERTLTYTASKTSGHRYCISLHVKIEPMPPPVPSSSKFKFWGAFSVGWNHRES
jgi:hypothetical protein